MDLVLVLFSSTMVIRVTKIGKKSSKKNRTGPRPVYNEDYDYRYNEDYDYYRNNEDYDYYATNGKTENAVEGPVWEQALLTAFVGEESTTSGVVGGRSDTSSSTTMTTTPSTEKFAKAQGLDNAAAAEDRFEEVRLHDGRGGAAGTPEGSSLWSSRNELAADATTFQPAQVQSTTDGAKQGWWIGGGVALLLAILLVLVFLVRELVRACRRRRQQQHTRRMTHHKEAGLPRGIDYTPHDDDTLVLNSSEEEGRTYPVEIDTGRVVDFKKSIDLNRHRGSTHKPGGPPTPTDAPTDTASCSPITTILDDLEHMCNGCGILGPSLEPSAGVGLEDLTLTIEDEEERAVVFQQPHM